MRQCHICGSTQWIERHHVFGGSNRKNSERYGLVADLSHFCHNEPPDGEHFNRENRERLQAEFQRRAMLENGWTAEDFRAVFHKSYI